MSNPDSSPTTSAFDKARTGLWASLQKHLAAVYEAEKAFLGAVAFAETLPFSPAAATAEQLADYGTARTALRDLYTDETAQLDTLVKAIRTKSYAPNEKKQLFLLLLGYMDIASSAFELLTTHVSSRPLPDEELLETGARFDRVRKFARLNIKGVAGLLAQG